MTWEIFLGIVALVGFIGSVGIWIWKLSNILTVLETTLATLNQTVKEFKSDAKAEHTEMHVRLDDHENRIVKLEIKVENKEE